MYEGLTGRTGNFEGVKGTERTIYIAPIADFATIAEPPAFGAITGVDDASVITADHTFKTGKQFHAIKIITSGKTGGESVGDKGGRNISGKFEGSYVGATKDQFGFQRLTKEDEFICLIPLLDGTVQQIGTEEVPADIMVNFASGTDDEGRKEATITIESNDKSLWAYEGAIQLTPAI